MTGTSAIVTYHYFIFGLCKVLLHVTFESVVMKCKKKTMKKVNSNCAHLLL